MIIIAVECCIPYCWDFSPGFQLVWKSSAFFSQRQLAWLAGGFRSGGEELVGEGVVSFVSA